MFAAVATDENPSEECDAAVTHPSCVGYTFTEKPPKISSPHPPLPPNRLNCKNKLPFTFPNHFD